MINIEESKSNHSPLSSSPLSPHDPAPNLNLTRDYNTGRLSKVSEENSNNNFAMNSNDGDFYDEYVEYEYDPTYASLSNPGSNPNSQPNTTTVSLSLPAPSSATNSNLYMGYHHQLYQQNRHNNTPHTNDNDQNIIINAYNDTPHELIPERIRLLLDRYAVNGYLQSNAPPPANKILIDKLAEVAVDESFLQNNLDCAICKVQLKIGETIKTLQCKHYFHSKCIVTWLNIHASCPLCRHRLNPNEYNMDDSAAATAAEDAHTRSMLNRLQDLRRRRRNRRTLRSQTRSNSTSGNRTPITMNSRNTNNMQQAATQLINAVTQILDQYAATSQQPQINDPNFKRLKRLISSPRPRPRTPHSSRSNTQILTRNNLSELALSPPSAAASSQPQAAPLRIMHQMQLSEDIDDLEFDVNDDPVPISANKIKQDFYKWNRKRRSRLDSVSAGDNNNNYNCNELLNIFTTSSNATTPSPAPPMMMAAGYKYKYSPQITTELSNSTMIIKSGQTTPNICAFDEDALEIMDPNDDMVQMNEIMDGYDEGCAAADELRIFDMMQIDGDISRMSEEQLENAKTQHKNIINKQQRIIEQIQQEKNKRLVNSQWKCPECHFNQRAFLFLPCRHLGLCMKCNLTKVSKAMKCCTCNCVINQKIPINFDI